MLKWPRRLAVETKLKPIFIDIDLHEDDRGSVHCIMDNLCDFGIKRIYCVENFGRGQVRAWHAHKDGDTYMYCANGSVKVGGLNIDDMLDITTGVLTARRPRLFFVPRGFANGAMSLTDNTKLIVMSTLSFKEVRRDDIRLPWDAVSGVWEVKNR